MTPSPPAPSTDDAVKDVGMSTFVAEVIEASKTAVILVDFWATWCGPCKQLTPTLEKIARESKGAVKLAKIDVDKNQPIAQQMGVQSVPSVFAFYQGRPIDAFAGALPEAQIKTWLEGVFKQTGAPLGDDVPDLGLALDQAAEFLANKEIDTARAVYLDVLDMDPLYAGGHAGLVRCLIEEGKVSEARQALDALAPEILKDKAIAPVKASLELLEQASAGGAESSELETKLATDPSDHQARFDLALVYFAAGKREQAVDELLEIIKREKGWNEDAARKQLVKFFEVFGMMDPLTVSARKRLSSMLFS